MLDGAPKIVWVLIVILEGQSASVKQEKGMAHLI